MKKTIGETTYEDAEFISRQTGGTEGVLQKRILKWLPKSGKLLNVGCGPFQEADILKSHGLTIYGCDISKSSINIAGKKCVKAKVCDARVSIPFGDGFFDVVYSVEVLEHLGQIRNYFKEMGRVTKCGGILIISCPLLGWWKNRLKILMGKDIFDDCHCRYFTIDSIKKCMEDGGFTLTDYEVAGKLGFVKKSLCGHIFLKAIKSRDTCTGEIGCV